MIPPKHTKNTFCTFFLSQRYVVAHFWYDIVGYIYSKVMLKCLVYLCRSLLHEQIAYALSFIRRSHRAQLQRCVLFYRMGYLARTSLSQVSSRLKFLF